MDVNYIWDVLLKARKEQMDDSRLRFVPAVSFSPYMELSLEDLNATVPEQIVEINPYYRFYTIFRDLFPADDAGYAELRETLFDVVVHFLAEADLMQGMNRREYHIRFVRRDLLHGIFGERIQQHYAQLDDHEQDAIAEGLLRLYETGEAVHLLKQTLRRIFPRSIIYAHCHDRDELLIYIGQEENISNRTKVELLLDLFLPARFDLRIYWSHHFGIVGEDDTMKQDAISLY